MTREEREAIELDLLLEALFRAYGYDFRSYTRASIERRARQFLVRREEPSLAALIHAVLVDEGLANRLIQSFSVNVTDMFRDPWVYRCIRADVLPLLRTYPFINLWHAGCASGEEVYSMAILLKEDGMLERSNLFATDFNVAALEQGRSGIYSAKDFKGATTHYQEAGGRQAFSDYYHARYESVVMDAGLRKHITFSSHNLTTDGVFGEMQMVLCRNVLIYFNDALRERALQLFTESLVHGGFLCLGSKESLRFSSVREQYELVDEKARIYRKKCRP